MATIGFEGDLGGALCAAALAHADRPALWVNGQRLTYRELFDSAARIAGGLKQAGVSPGERVGILATKSPTAYAGVIGVLMAGCTYVPLNPLFKPERNGTVLRSADLAALVLNDVCAGRLEDFLDDACEGLALLLPDSEAVSTARSRSQITKQDLPDIVLDDFAPQRTARTPDDTAVILFTSGTTGVPKGVPLTHRNLSAYVGGVSEVVQITPEDRCMQLVGLTFDLSMHDMFLTWLNGAELYSMPENVGPLMSRLVRQHGITTCFLVPSPVARCIQQGQVKPGSMPSLRATFIAGEALPYPVAKAWSEGAPNTAVYNLYGPTEATVSITWHRFDPQADAQFAVVPIGRPFGHDRADLFDPELKRVTEGVYGQILLSGDQVAQGYWRAPHLDEEKFTLVEGRRWYKTGDLGRWIEPYGLVFAGRADRQVKIRGYLVDLQEIEGVMRTVCAREEIAVLPWPLVAEGSYDGTVAFVTGEETDAAAVRASCRARVSDYMTPDRVIFVDALPANANGKVDYKVLAQHPDLQGPAR